MMLEYPAKVSIVADSGVLACFRTEELKSLGEELLAAGPGGKGDTGRIRASSAHLTEGPLREKLLALLVQESPYPEEMIDRLLADTIRKIRERSNKEKGKILTRRITEAEKAKDQELHDRLVAEKNRLLQEEKAFPDRRADFNTLSTADRRPSDIYDRTTGRNRYGKRNRIR